MKHMRIHGIGSVVGKRVISNKDLESIVGDNFDIEKAKQPFCDWVEQLTGIKERRWTDKETTEDMMYESSKIALEDAGMDIDDIDFIISATETGNSIIPDPSIEIAHRLGSDWVPGFTFDAACAGFVYGLKIAYSLIANEHYKNILLVCGETLHKRLNKDPKTIILLADAAGAVVLGPNNEKGISSMPYVGARYSKSISLNENMPNDENIYDKGRNSGYIIMGSGEDVFKTAVHSMVDGARAAIKRSGFSESEIQERAWLNIHQANLRIIESSANRLKIPLERTMLTIIYEGNPSAPSNIRSLDKYVKEGKVKRGDLVLITAVGGGYKYGGAVMEY